MWRAEQYIAGKTVVLASISCSCTTMWITSQQVSRWDPWAQHECGILGLCIDRIYCHLYRRGRAHSLLSFTWQAQGRSPCGLFHWSHCCELSGDALFSLDGKILSLFLPPTSFVMSHSCTTVIVAVKWSKMGRARQTEREHVEISTTAAFVHDSNNEVFIYNVFCFIK